ncbi:Glycosyl transferase family 2 [Mycoavidus cysteinexigens]|uniref:Glycosyl transferase family 2 n=1 Tax=Mycoavidus cysteinexigens TaxID=1553431 RepID=A0A2Z6EUG0_9BURK|nr:glycosyltransferase family 2 protein [Mycoavidus cysteinexigens]BBE09087.1 Glycosyl transferase family 2 [Mycoavidus cysteinexigens]GAM52173.1 putative two-domain glycosyltransferase [bacterium endosymbiont of Mortierella elongata FMR23-6]GLR00248.1 glycosyl transferase [Mycoavidus cysteinexigens]
MAHANFLISVIISTYNRPDALALVLDQCLAQTDTNYEVIVADDGSGEPTRAVIEAATNHTNITVSHVWQADQGFRAAAIRNKGIAQARGEYLIFLDGDCVPQRDFIACHRALAETGWTVTGSRILLNEALTSDLLAQRLSLTQANWGFWVQQRFAQRINKLLPLLVKLPNFAQRRVNGFKWRGIKSCNLAAWAANVHAINGFDEDFSGWGHEDADFVARLYNAGVCRKRGFYATEVLHLWHQEQPRDSENINYQRVLAVLQSKRTWAKNGLDQALMSVRSMRPIHATPPTAKPF